MRDLDSLPARTGSGRFRVVVETPRGSNLKLKYEPALGVFTVSRPLALGVTYPFDWGFVPSTRAPDGDPLDAMVLHDGATYPGVVLTCRALGVLRATQKNKDDASIRERNDRVIAVPERSAQYDAVPDARVLPARLRRELEHFFEVVVELEDKGLRLEGWDGPDPAEGLVDSSSCEVARKR